MEHAEKISVMIKIHEDDVVTPDSSLNIKTRAMKKSVPSKNAKSMTDNHINRNRFFLR